MCFIFEMAARQPSRRLTFQQAVRAILQDVDASDEEDAFNDFTDEEPVPPGEMDVDRSVDGSGDGEQLADDDEDIEIFVEEEELEHESASSDDETDGIDEEIEDTPVIANGIVYSRIPPAERRWERNIIDPCNRPRNLVQITKEIEAFLLFMPEELLRTALRHTNRKCNDVSRQRNKKIPSFSFEEFLACLGIVIRLGADRDNFTSLDDIWSTKDGRPFYRSVISRNRFKTLLCVLRFDNHRTRRQRIPQNRLAAISEVWNMFLDSLRRVYVPGPVLTVDEQLLGYRGKVPGRTYMPSKPRKYGLKFFWLCEAGTGFALNGIVYTGRRENEPVHHNLGEDVVIELVHPYFGSHRQIVTDNFFTSHRLAVALLQHGLTILGTIIRKHRREVPAILREKKAQFTSLFLYDLQNKITLVSYSPTRNRIVLLLSSFHGRGVIDYQSDLRRPEMILDYNQGKGGVDQMDENIEEFSCVRKTVRWPLLVFFNLLNVACNNAHVFLKRNAYTKSKKEFLRELSVQLAGPFAKQRHLRNRGLHRHIVNAAQLFGFVSESAAPSPVKKKVGRCYMCSTSARGSCDRCGQFICPRHKNVTKATVCSTCL